MTEGEWLACVDPNAILNFLRGRIGDRKLALFARACCEPIWTLLTDARSRQALLVRELHLDGMAGDKELQAAARGAATAAPAAGASAPASTS